MEYDFSGKVIKDIAAAFALSDHSLGSQLLCPLEKFKVRN